MHAIFDNEAEAIRDVLVVNRLALRFGSDRLFADLGYVGAKRSYDQFS